MRCTLVQVLAADEEHVFAQYSSMVEVTLINVFHHFLSLCPGDESSFGHVAVLWSLKSDNTH